MPVQIIINGENAGESIKELATLSAALTGKTEAVAEQPVQEEQKPRQRKNTTPKKEEPAKEESSPQPDPEESTKPEQPEPEETTDNYDDGAPIPTVVELRAKAQEKGKTQEGKAAIKALLKKFESKSISEVPEAKRAAFYAELEKI